MIITCDECQARFRLADEKLKPGGTKVRCSKCRHVFTVMPTEAEPTEDGVDFGAFNMEPVTGEEPAAPPHAAVPAAPPATAAGDMGLDFGGLEQAVEPGRGESEFVEEFSFAAPSPPAAAPPGAEATPPAPAGGVDELDLGSVEAAGELDFDATFAETDEAPDAPAAAEPGGFAGHAELAEISGGEARAEITAFRFEDEPEGSAASEFSLEEETLATAAGDFGGATAPAALVADEFSFAAESASGLSEFGFETKSAGESPAFGDEPAGTESSLGFEFGSGDSFESSVFDEEPAAGDEGATAWAQPQKAAGPSFDFDEPNFETMAAQPPAMSRDEAGMNFGEIDFAGAGAAPNFAAEPDFPQATPARPADAESSQPPPPPPRPAPSRAQGEASLPVRSKSRNSPMSRVVLLLIVLLLALCGTGGYFYFMGDGRQIFETLLLKVKGEEPAAPVEQRIGLKIAGSSYVDNRTAGQLLVIQGSATNNFAGARSAITVKGLLLDAGGRLLQQQTVFCGNYLSEDKLRTMTYAQIEEAMNNQFGDSLANMNVKPGVELRFTIVFRNLPKEMANINVEVVDSKAGGL